ncbi:MAG: HAD-IC family P-type ATPase [Candidatus Ryanbacteria bacterium]|nr:HAD-IC family P-type ATPase [Candidatus Ryanbacteria bacterium]
MGLLYHKNSSQGRVFVIFALGTIRLFIYNGSVMPLDDKTLKTSFWALPISSVVDLLKTDTVDGLSEKEADKRLKTFGLNIIEKERHTFAPLIFLNQFKSPLILILLFAGIVTLVVSHYRDSLFIFAAIVVNAALGFYQEYKAEKALAELKTYLKQRSRVIRDGVEREIDAAHLVPGDLIRLTQGDRVPADARSVFVNDLQVDEAILTGESLPVSKSVEPVSTDTALGDQRSMVFAGTLVTQGVGTAVVCRTDLSTELGKIAALVAKSHREETPLSASIRQFSIHVSVFLGLLTLLIFVLGLASGYSFLEIFLTSVAIAVAAVPEGLPVAMTVILAMGVQRMARRKGVVRRLVAAEALGSTTIILTDKTGTLTMAKMELGKILPEKTGEEKKLLELALLNTNVLIENRDDPPPEWRMNGRVLEVALVRSAALESIMVEEVKKRNTIVNSLPFNAVNKFSVSLVRDRGKHFLVFFGAPDILIRHSTLDAAEHKKVLERIHALASSGELVVGVATKEIEPEKDFSFSKDLKVTHLSFEGLITLRDPVRTGVKEAMRRVERAGVRTLILTGDHRGTAEAIAKELGMRTQDKNVLDALEFRALSDEDLKKRLPTLRIISRVSPLDKMRVAKALQEMGEVVAMTGDGVNDAPSMKQADIGIAMGSGTEVARDVADLVLLDDNFETIVAAIEEGRQIMQNIRKVIVYLFSSMADELLLIGGALVTGLALPLNALQILWVNFFSDSFPAIAFAFEKDIDGLYPRPRGLFDPLMKFLILFVGLSTSALLFVLYWFLLRAGFPEDIVRTFIFASFGSYTLFLAFSLRSLEKSIFQYPIFSNRYLVLGITIGIVLIAAGIYIPFLQTLLGTVPLPPRWLLGVILIWVLNIAAAEFGKWIFRRSIDNKIET